MNKAASYPLKVLALTGALATMIQSFPCDKAYHFQSASEVILSGKTQSSLKPGSRTSLPKNLDGMSVLIDSTAYKVITDFNGASSCSDWVKTGIDYAVRAKKGTHTTPLHETNNYIRLFAGDYNNNGFAYWFGIGIKDTGAVSLYDIVGKPTASSQLQVWYGNALLTKEIIVKNVGTVKYTSFNFYNSAPSDPDSAALQKRLTDPWKTEVDNDTQRVTLKVQLIKVTYDSVASAGVRRAGSRAEAAGLQARQIGNMVLIQPGQWDSEAVQPLGLFNMMGHRIAFLHPTGYAYQWNGKVETGADAPTGVYFVQQGNRVLGKFFYTR